MANCRYNIHTCIYIYIEAPDTQGTTTITLLLILHAQDISVLEKKLIEHEDAGKQPLLVVAYAGRFRYRNSAFRHELQDFQRHPARDIHVCTCSWMFVVLRAVRMGRGHHRYFSSPSPFVHIEKYKWLTRLAHRES